MSDVNFTFDDNVILDQTYYIPSDVWDLSEVDKGEYSHANKFRNVPDYKIDTNVIFLTLRQRPMYFMLNSIFPCLVLNVLLLLLFGLPHTSQPNIAMTVFLTFAVYSSRIVSEIPAQGDYLPRITLYFLFSLVFSVFTFAWFVCENFMRNERYMPGWLEKALSQIRKALKNGCGEKKMNKHKVPDELVYAIYCCIEMHDIYDYLLFYRTIKRPWSMRET